MVLTMICSGIVLTIDACGLLLALRDASIKLTLMGGWTILYSYMGKKQNATIDDSRKPLFVVCVGAPQEVKTLAGSNEGDRLIAY
jgi:hypothetical protein